MGSDLSEVTTEQIEFEIAESKRRYFTLKVEGASDKGNSGRRSVVRRSIARMLTELGRRSAEGRKSAR